MVKIEQYWITNWCRLKFCVVSFVVEWVTDIYFFLRACLKSIWTPGEHSTQFTIVADFNLVRWRLHSITVSHGHLLYSHAIGSQSVLNVLDKSKKDNISTSPILGRAIIHQQCFMTCSTTLRIIQEHASRFWVASWLLGSSTASLLLIQALLTSQTASLDILQTAFLV